MTPTLSVHIMLITLYYGCSHEYILLKTFKYASWKCLVLFLQNELFWVKRQTLQHTIWCQIFEAHNFEDWPVRKICRNNFHRSKSTVPLPVSDMCWRLGSVDWQQLVRRFINYDNRQTNKDSTRGWQTIKGLNPGILPQWYICRLYELQCTNKTTQQNPRSDSIQLLSAG